MFVLFGLLLTRLVGPNDPELKAVESFCCRWVGTFAGSQLESVYATVSPHDFYCRRCFLRCCPQPGKGLTTACSSGSRVFQFQRFADPFDLFVAALFVSGPPSM